MATKPKKSAAPPYPGYLSPQQQLKLATQSVSAALSPQTQLAQQQITQAQTGARNAALGQKDAYAALADVYAKEAPATDQVYTDAANRQATFAKGFSDAMQTIQQQAVDQSNKLLDQNGAPSGQHLNAGSQGDVVYALGGYNPASVLNAQGAAFKTAALGRAGEAKGLGQQAYDEALAKGAANVTTLKQQLAQIQAQRPNLLQQALNSIQGQQSNAQANYIQEQYLNNTLANGVASRTGIDPVTGQPTLSATNAANSAAAKRAAARTKAVQRRNDAVVSSLASSRDWVEKQLAPGTQPKKAADVPIKVGTTKIGKVSVPTYAKVGGGTTTDVSKAATKAVYNQVPIPRPQYKALLRQLTGRLTDELRGFGIKPAVIRAYAEDILDDYYRPAQINPPPRVKKNGVPVGADVNPSTNPKALGPPAP